MRHLKHLAAYLLALAVPLCTQAQTETEPNSNSGSANVLTYNTAMTGRMGVCSPTDNSTDYFKIINLPQGQLRVQSTMSNTGPVGLEVTVQVRQTTTSVIGTYTLTAGANGTPVNDSFVFPCQGGTGNYYLSLLNPSTTYCTNYVFTVDVVAPYFANDPEPNNGGSSSVPVAVNTWQQGQTSFYYGDNSDYYRLDLPTNGVLNIEWEAEQASSTTGATATAILRNTNTSAIQTWTLPVGTNSVPATGSVSLSCRSNTNYYILSVSSGICGTSYRFRYTVTPPVFANDPESNGGSGSAVTIPIDIPQEGHLNFLTYNENSDYYRLTLPDDGVLSVTVAAEHVGSDVNGTFTLSLRNTNTAVIQTWTAPVGASSVPVSSTFTRPCTGSTAIYYLSITSSICGASYRFSYSLAPPVFANDLEPNNNQFTTPQIDLNATSQEGHLNNYYDTGTDGYLFYHAGDTLKVDFSAEHAGSTQDTTYVAITNSSYHNTIANVPLIVGANSIPYRNRITIGVVAAQNLRYYLGTEVCGVSYKFHCRDADNDGTCNASDLCANGPEPGTPCNDGDVCTTNDVIQPGCGCAGTFADADSDGTCDANDLCPSSPEPGSPCNDNNACTINDVVDTNCNCAGTFSDSDNDGTCDANDLCPGGQEPGTPCDDNDEDTSGDVIGPDCLCAGALVDCLGVPGGTAVPGTPCNDNNACTTNDIYQLDCGCAGTVQDNDGDGTCDANDLCPGGPEPGTACNDNNACTTGDVIGANCLCTGTFADADNDGTCDASDLCPGGPEPGTACNDGDAGTENDAIGANCTCAGTPISGCVPSVQLEFQLDGASTVNWELRVQGTNAVAQSGSAFLPVTGAITQAACLPDGCYYLVVTDDGGDGITSNGAQGGYILRELPNRRIIDDRNNFLSGSTSQIAGGEGFCLPFGNDRLISASCDRTQLQRGATAACSDKLTADNTPNNTSGNVYQFQVFDPNGSEAPVLVPASGAGSNILAMNQLPTLTPGKLYNVRVRTRISAGVYRPWGPACRMSIGVAGSICPATKLVDDASSSNWSCGKSVTLPTGGNGNANMLVAVPVTRFNASCQTVSANKYQFRFRDVDTNVITVVNGVGANYYCYMTAPTFQTCRTYEVAVRASFDNGGTWCNYGTLCEVYTNGCAIGLNALEEGQSEPAEGLRMFPNPNRGDQLYLNLENISEGVSTVSVDIYDAFGRRVSARTIAVQDGFINTVVELNGELASGVYMVNVTAGETMHTERLVVAQ